MGWWADSAGARDRAYVAAYLGSDGADIAWDLIRAAFASVSRTSIVMMQARDAASMPQCRQNPSPAPALRGGTPRAAPRCGWRTRMCRELTLPVHRVTQLRSAAATVSMLKSLTALQCHCPRAGRTSCAWTTPRA